MRRLAWAWAELRGGAVWALCSALILVSAAVVPARAQDRPGQPPALARYFPRQDLVVYAEFGGLDDRQDLWRQTAAYRLLNETTTGVMLEELVAQLADRALDTPPARALTGREWVALVEDVARSGFAFGLVRAPEEPKPSCIGLVVRGAGRGRLRAAVGTQLGIDRGPAGEGRVVEKPGGRKVTVVGEAPAQGFAWWFEGEDLVVSFGPPTGVDLIIECLGGGRPDAIGHPVRAALAAAESGFTPVGLAFFDRAALPPLPREAVALGLDKIERVDVRWGFDGAALKSVTRVVAPAPRSGVLAVLDQPAFDRRGLAPLPPGLAGFSAFSLAPDDFYDRLASLAGAIDPRGEAEAALKSFERTVQRATGMELRRDILAHFGPRMTYYVVPTRINAPSNILEGVAQGVVRVPKATLVIDVKDVEGAGRVLDQLVAGAQKFLQDQAAAPPQTPPAEIRRLKGVDRGYELSVPPSLLPLPAGLHPTMILGKWTLILGTTPAVARAALALEGKENGLPSGDPLAPALGAAPEKMVFLNVADTQQSLLPEVLANLPGLVQFFGMAATTRFRPAVGGRGGPQAPGERPFAVTVDADTVPDPDELRPFLFPSMLALGLDDQGFQFVSRESFPSVNPVALAPVGVALLLPAVQSARTAARRAQSTNNLKQIALAFHNYHSVHNRFPPQAIANRDGKPCLSWRVEILPFLEQQALFDEFKRDEPWDSPHNKALITRMPAVFAVPGASAAPGHTFYRGFSGAKALFDPEVKTGIGIASITDGTSNTLGIVEAKEAVPWTRPDAEIPFDPVLKPEQMSRLLQSLGGHFPGGFDAMFLDGSVRFIKTSINMITLHALITRNEGEVVSADAF
jgi:hypothetical protein